MQRERVWKYMGVHDIIYKQTGKLKHNDHT